MALKTRERAQFSNTIVNTKKGLFSIHFHVRSCRLTLVKPRMWKTLEKIKAARNFFIGDQQTSFDEFAKSPR